jgi:hypothetical protein
MVSLLEVSSGVNMNISKLKQAHARVGRRNYIWYKDNASDGHLETVAISFARSLKVSI